MSIASTVESCLERHRLPYAIISHPHGVSSRDTAAAAAVPPNRIAKPVLLRDEHGYLLVVVPSDRHVPVRKLSLQLGRRLHLVEGPALARLFEDCETGAIPPLGPAYGIDTVVDDDLFAQPRVCFVAGDHNGLLCVSQEAFRVLMQGARRARIVGPRPVTAVRPAYPEPRLWPRPGSQSP